MSLEQIYKVVGSVSKQIENSEKIAVPVLSVKLMKAAQQFPEDQTIGVMSNVVSKMESSNKVFITRAELKDLYKRLYTRNTKFAELFSDELGSVEKVNGPVIYNRDGDESKLSTVQEAYQKLSDPVLSRALAQAFGESDVNLYSKDSAQNAKNTCARELRDIGMPAQNIEVVAGQEDLLICSASFETPKGVSRVLIPVEILNNKAILPSAFVGNTGPKELDSFSLSEYITSTAGKKLNINPNALLKAASEIKNGKRQNISDIELAATKVNALKESKGEFFANSVLYQKIAEEPKHVEVELPEYKDEEVESFARMLNTAAGIAEFKFGKEKVKNVRQNILNKISEFGFPNTQISIAGADENTVIYAVAINSGRVGFRVPVKMTDKNLNASVIISNGSIKPFSKSSIYEILNKEDTDYKAAAIASPLYNLKSSELIDIVRKATAEGNYAKAEDALNVLSEGNDAKAYAIAFNVFTSGLSKTASSEQEECKCSMVIKTASSKYPICGHTNLPIHKVYQDKNGNCQPLYRKAKDETYEGGFFMAHKIFF